jgi:lambda repressor-like predicted transcriptional regulator
LSEEKQPTVSNRGALATANPDEILSRINQGASLRQLANELGVSNVGLRAWLLRENGEHYNEAITNALTLRVAEADDALEAADDVVSIARAREQARFARMDFERRRPALYGQRQQIMHDIGPDLGDLLRDARKRVASPQQTVIEGSIIDVSRDDNAK